MDNNIWQSIQDFFTANSWNIVKFVLILIFGFVACKLIVRIIKRLFENSRLEKITQKFIISILKVAIWVVYFMTLLQTVGVDLTGVIAAFTAAAVAIGLALENSLANLASGIILVSSHLFKAGDYISVAGVEGTVSNIGLMETCLISVDNKTIHIPNSNIVNNSLINYSNEKIRRVDFEFAVDYASDIKKVKEIILNVIKSDGKVLLTPAPTCRLKSLNASSITLFTTCWCDNEDYWDIYYYVMDRTFDEFKKNNISIPYNQLEVRLREDKVVMPTYADSLPQRKEKERAEEISGDFIDQIIYKQKQKNKEKKLKIQK